MADRDVSVFDDDGNLPLSLGVLQHLLHPVRVVQNVYVFAAIPEVLTGLRGVGSGVLAEDENLVRHSYPPIEYMMRLGCTKSGSLIPWPASFFDTASRINFLMSSSDAPFRRGVLRSVSQCENRQVR